MEKYRKQRVQEAESKRKSQDEEGEILNNAVTYIKAN